jgi:transcriptional regulator of heat shock response
VTDDDLRQRLAIYGPGLEAEVALLHQLKRLALAQRDATDTHDVDHLSFVAQDRDRIMASLVTVEYELRPAREALAAELDKASALPGFEEVVALHRTAADLVATIVQSDQDTVRALQDAEVSRRLAAQTIGAAGSTLAAYRRVVAPPLTGAGLVDRHG